MNLNDRLALEIGRTLLRALTAEAQLAEATARIAELEAEKPKAKKSSNSQSKSSSLARRSRP